VAGRAAHAIVPPLSLRGPTLTIRKFSPVPITPQDLVRSGCVGPRALRFLQHCVRGRANIVISGGAGSGKTTLLGVLAGAIPDGERLLTIEDAAELRLAKPHVVSLEARPANVEGRGEVTVRDLVRNALRMRPDRIIVGEVRGGEALDMLQAMNTGHEGSLSTAHANFLGRIPSATGRVVVGWMHGPVTGPLVQRIPRLDTSFANSPRSGRSRTGGRSSPTAQPACRLVRGRDSGRSGRA
jgi:Flp pilus assembly CpaF family ATPase